MSRIQDPSKIYSALRYYVDATFNLAYRRVQYLGADRIPKDGAVIFGPNHTNALMDALAILVVQHGPSVFVARADIFKKPAVAKLLRFFKIMPIMRIRDGYENLKKNQAIMQEATDVLESKVPFCIMPEGTHRPMHSLLPLVKGIFRIALMADAGLKDKMPVYILPTGIEYGDYFRYRSTLLVEIGEPLNVTEFAQQHANLDTAEMLNALKDELSGRMKKIILFIDDDQYYDGAYDLCLMGYPTQLTNTEKKRASLYEERNAKQSVVNLINRYKTEEPAQATKWLEQACNFSKERLALGIANETVIRGTWPAWHLALHTLWLFIKFPYFLFSAIVSSPTLLLTRWLTSKMDDRAFDNSIRYVATLVMTPLIWLILTICYFIFLNWPVAIIGALVTLPCHLFVESYWKTGRMLKSQFIWMARPTLRAQRKAFLEQLKNLSFNQQ